MTFNNSQDIAHMHIQSIIGILKLATSCYVLSDSIFIQLGVALKLFEANLYLNVCVEVLCNVIPINLALKGNTFV